MAGPLAVVALVVSGLMLATAVLALILLRKGEGPRYGASRGYEANRRAAFRAVTGESVDAIPGDQWYDPDFDRPGTGADVEPRFARAVREAVRAVAPSPPDEAADGTLRVEGARVVAAVSTAALRERLRAGEEPGGPVAGVVLFNPEPPGGDAARVALPVQSLFPALRRAGREDLIRRIEGLRAEARSAHAHPPGGTG